MPLIQRLVEQLPVGTACDLFAGTTRVGQGLRRLGLTVHSNDLATYSEALGQAYIVAGGVARPDAARTDPRGALGARRARRVLHGDVLPPGALPPARERGSRRRDSRRDRRLRPLAGRARRAPHCAARGRRPRRQHDGSADGVPEGVGAALVQRRSSCGFPSRCRGRWARCRASMRTRSRHSSTSTSSTSTRRTTSTRSSPTTTCGKPSCAGMRRRRTASRTSGWTAPSIGAPTTRSARRRARWPS